MQCGLVNGDGRGLKCPDVGGTLAEDGLNDVLQGQGETGPQQIAAGLAGRHFGGCNRFLFRRAGPEANDTFQFHQW